MGMYKYRGVDTRWIYEFNSPLVDANGHPVVGGQYSIADWNGEKVVYANRDGSVARGTAGPGILAPSTQAGIGMISKPTVTPSAWEQLVPTIEPPPEDGGVLPGGGSTPLGG